MPSALLAVAVVVGTAMVVAAVDLLVRRAIAIRRPHAATAMRRHVSRPLVLAGASVAALVVGRSTVSGWFEHTLLATAIAASGWLASRLLVLVERALLGHFSIERPDNLQTRTILTQVLVLRRVTSAAVATASLIAIAWTFAPVRELAPQILGAAGLVGVVLGIAGRSTIGNVVAGIQVAVAEPIRLDDVVVIDGEWGNVEEITLTYVVVRVWDQRRLVLPTTRFVDQSFQNWTRRTSDLLAPVDLWVDHTAPIDELRAELRRITEGSPLWDGRVCVLQMTETAPTAVLLRALVSAKGSTQAWDLRCEVREGLVAWLRDHHPHALPQVRLGAIDDGEGTRPDARQLKAS